MKRLRAVLGNTGAWLTVAVTLVGPFVLFGWFQAAIGRAGLRINPAYSGGEVARVITRNGYKITVNQPVLRGTPFARIDSFVQVSWSPAARLPESIVDEVDLDGDGAPEVLVSFDSSKLVVDVTPLRGNWRPAHIAGVVSFSRLIARVNDAIIVRIPMG